MRRLDLTGPVVSVTRGVILQDLYAAAVAMHVAEAADIHQDVEAKFLPAAIGARDLVEASAMAQPQVDNFASPRVGHARNHSANLPTWGCAIADASTRS